MTRVCACACVCVQQVRMVEKQRNEHQHQRAHTHKKNKEERHMRVWMRLLAQVRGEVHRQLIDLRVVVRLDLMQHLHVLLRHEVDRNTLTAVAATATDAVQVVLLVRRQVEVDDDVYVVHVNTTSHEVRRDEHAGAAAAEGVHDTLAVALRHLGVHAADGVVALVQLIGDPVHLATGVGEDDGLGDGDRLVEVHEGVELVLFLDGDEELLNALQRQALALHENADGVTHELLRQLQHLLRHRGGEEGDLDILRQEAEDLVNLVGKALRQHLISLVQHQYTQHLRPQRTTLDHIGHTARCADGDDHAILQLAQVILHTGATYKSFTEAAAVRQEFANAADHLRRLQGQFASRGEHEALDHVVAEVQALQQTNREGTSLTRAGLRLGDDVTTARERGDGALLNARRLLKTVGVDTAQKVLVQRHVIEGRDRANAGLIVHEGILILRGNLVLLGHDCCRCEERKGKEKKKKRAV